MPCTRCGSNLGPNDKFCGQCGAQTKTQMQVSEILEPTPADDVLNTCHSCGAGLTEGQMYCSVCGKPAIDLGDSE